MRLEEAIELLGWVIEDKKYRQGEPGYDALKLGIEALKLLEEIRTVPGTGYSAMLPGETED